jgi:hypothetical protein
VSEEGKYTADLAGLVAWLEQGRGDTEYDYTDPQDCLLCRFLKQGCGLPVYDVGPRDWRTGPEADRQILDPILNRVAQGSGARTYSAALERARALLAETTP